MDSMNQNVSKHIVFTIMDKDANFVKAEVNKKNTINDLISKIQDYCGIPLQNQWFTCQDQRISSNDNSVAENENKQEKEAFFDVNDNISINVETLNGEFMIKVNENNSIENVMAKIKNEFNIPLNRQCFTCSDCKTLSDQFFLKEYQKLLNDTPEEVISAVENIGSNDTVDNDHEKEQEAKNDQLMDKEKKGLTVQLTHVDINNVVNDNDEKSEDEESSSSSGSEDESDEEFYSSGEETNDEESYLVVKNLSAFDNNACFINQTLRLYEKIIFSLDDIPDQSLLINYSLNAKKSCPLKPVIPKIFKCEVEILNLCEQSLSWKEYQFLTFSGKIKWLTLQSCIIKYENGSLVGADKLFVHLPNLVEFEVHSSSSFQTLKFRSETVNKIVQILSCSSELKIFNLAGLTEDFNISEFSNFIMENTTIKIHLVFQKNGLLSDAYKQKLRNCIQEIITNEPAKIPHITFPGISSMNEYSIYQKIKSKSK